MSLHVSDAPRENAFDLFYVVLFCVGKPRPGKGQTYETIM